MKGKWKENRERKDDEKLMKIKRGKGNEKNDEIRNDDDKKH
jgi:hypothetical protein